MNRFLFKVNGKRDCPEGICRPKFASEWEGGEVLIPTAVPIYVTKNGKQSSDAVHDGDELWIWTHEYKKSGHGWGLTSKARAGQQREHGKFHAITLEHVELLPHPFGFNYLGNKPTGSWLLDYVYDHREHRAYLLDDTEYSDFKQIVDQYGFPVPDKLGNSDETVWGREIQENNSEILKALTERRLNWQKARPAQAQFRSSLLEEYNGRCVLTGCSVLEALEAAHVLPHNGDPLRDRVDNGLLLRRDLHSMFDAMLWSIDPDTRKVCFSGSVKDKPYVRLNESKIDHKVAPEPLRVHFIEFQKANSDASSTAHHS